MHGKSNDQLSKHLPLLNSESVDASRGSIWDVTLQSDCEKGGKLSDSDAQFPDESLF